MTDEITPINGVSVEWDTSPVRRSLILGLEINYREEPDARTAERLAREIQQVVAEHLHRG